MLRMYCDELPEATGVASDQTYSAMAEENHELASDLAGKNSFRDFRDRR